MPFFRSKILGPVASGMWTHAPFACTVWITAVNSWLHWPHIVTSSWTSPQLQSTRFVREPDLLKTVHQQVTFSIFFQIPERGSTFMWNSPNRGWCIHYLKFWHHLLMSDWTTYDTRLSQAPTQHKTWNASTVDTTSTHREIQAVLTQVTMWAERLFGLVFDCSLLFLLWSENWLWWHHWLFSKRRPLWCM